MLTPEQEKPVRRLQCEGWRNGSEDEFQFEDDKSGRDAYLGYQGLSLLT
jgi:hypothetical protein